jgi:hypothetical protein
MTHCASFILAPPSIPDELDLLSAVRDVLTFTRLSLSEPEAAWA